MACGVCRVWAGTSGALLRDERGMRRCLDSERGGCTRDEPSSCPATTWISRAEVSGFRLIVSNHRSAEPIVDDESLRATVAAGGPGAPAADRRPAACHCAACRPEQRHRGRPALDARAGHGRAARPAAAATASTPSVTAGAPASVRRDGSGGRNLAGRASLRCVSPSRLTSSSPQASRPRGQPTWNRCRDCEPAL